MPSAKRMISASRRSSGSFCTPSRMRLQLLAPLDERLGVVWRADDRRVLDRGLRLARAVAVEVRREVVGDPDEPRAQRAAVGLALRALEVPVGLQEGLLGQVLRVVVIAHAVVRVRVHVAQVLRGRGRRTPRRAAPWFSPWWPRMERLLPFGQAARAFRAFAPGAVMAADQRLRLDPPRDQFGETADRGGAGGPRRAARPRAAGTASTASAVWPRIGVTSAPGTPAASSSPARRLRPSAATHGGDEVARPGQPGERLGPRAAAARQPLDLREHLAGGGAGDVRARRGRRRPRPAPRRSWRSRPARRPSRRSCSARRSRRRRATSASRRAKAPSTEATTSEAPCCERVAGVGRAADAADRLGGAPARRRTRSGACPAAARGPWPRPGRWRARARAAPCSASAAGRSRAGTARQTRSAPARSSSAAA